MSMAAKKLVIKVRRSDDEAVLLVHIRAARAALGSQSKGFAEREMERSSMKRR